MSTFFRISLVASLLFIFCLVFSNSAHAISSFECVFQYAGIPPVPVSPSVSISSDSHPACTSIDTGSMGFRIPSLGDLLTFAIRAFFVIAGLAALFYLLLGAFAWISSGGDKDSITAARDKIQAAVLGMILIVAVLAIIWTLEQVIFNRRICLGLSCPLTLPGLLTTTGNVGTQAFGALTYPVMETSSANCCVCLDRNGDRKEAINTFLFNCQPDGTGVPR